MNTQDQNGKHTQKVPKGYKLVHTANGKKLVKVPTPPKKTWIQKLFGK